MIDSTNGEILRDLGTYYGFIGKYKESLNVFQKWLNSTKTQEILDVLDMHRIGYAYYQCGYKEEANFYFREQIILSKRMIELKRSVYGQVAYYDLAATYAFTGDSENAYKYLRLYYQKMFVNLQYFTLIRTDPLFRSIRNEPEFQKIVRDVEAKYQTEHERVRKWLEKNNML